MTARESGGPGAVLRDLRLGFRTAGASGFIGQVISETLGRVYQKRRYMVIEQELRHVQDIGPPDGVDIGPFEGDWAPFADMLTRRGIARFEHRLAAGRTCLLAQRGGRALGYTWISPDIETAVEFLPLALPNDAAYLWDLFVSRDARGLGVGSALTSARLLYARDAGFRLGWRAISPDNRPSVRTAEKTGSVRILGEVTYVRRLGRTVFAETRDEGRPLLTGDGA